MEENKECTVYVVDFVNKQLLMTVKDPLERDFNTIESLVQSLINDFKKVA